MPRVSQDQLDARRRRQQPEDAGAAAADSEDVAAEHDGHEQHRDVQRRAAVEDNGDESHVVAESPQGGAETPEARVAAAAVVALLVVDADERAAGCADDGPGALTLEHHREAYNIGRMRVVVTGGTGYLGSAIVRALDREGHVAVAFARRASAAGLPGTATDGDIRDAPTVRRAIEGADAVCHTAALVSVWQPRRTAFDDVNVAGLRTVLDALDMTGALVRARITRFWTNRGNGIVQDYKLGLRMLLKYPGLTLAGGLALAIAIGLGAGWYDLSRDLFRPTLPFPGGDRIVEVDRMAGAHRRVALVGEGWDNPPEWTAWQEREPAVRVVLGHFVFVYIHPYTDGNGRTGRFLMNLMLAAGGYSWTVVPLQQRDARGEGGSDPGRFAQPPGRAALARPSRARPRSARRSPSPRR